MQHQLAHSSEYTTMDRVGDFFSRNEELVSRGTGTIKAGLGTIGTQDALKNVVALAALPGKKINAVKTAVVVGVGSVNAYFAAEGIIVATSEYESIEGHKSAE